MVRLRRTWAIPATATLAVAMVLAACGGTGHDNSGAAASQHHTAASQHHTAASQHHTTVSAQPAAASQRRAIAVKLPTRPALAPAADVKLAVKPPGKKTRVGRPLYTRGFNVWNLSGHPLTLASVTGDGVDGRPPDGSVLQPGHYDHYEITWYFLTDQIVTANYASGPLSFSAWMKVIGLDGGVYTRCDSRGSPCSAGGAANPTIVFLDPPGTVRTIPPSQGQSQKDLLSQLCGQSIDDVTCKFKITGESQTFSDPPTVVGSVHVNNTDSENDIDDTCSFTAGTTDSWGVEATVGIEKLVAAEVTATYHHEVTNETTFEERVRYQVSPADAGWATIAWPVNRDTGDFTVTAGNTTWRLNSVYYDFPYTTAQTKPTWTTHTLPKDDPGVPRHAKTALAANDCTPN